MKTLMFAALVSAASLSFGMPWQDVAMKSASNIGVVKGPIKGIVIEHHGCGCSQCTREAGKAITNFTGFATGDGWVYIHPRTGPNWANDATVKLTDDLVEAVIGHYGLPSDVPIISIGKSMGGMGTLAWPAFSRYRANIRAIFANCPVTDLVAMYRHVNIPKDRVLIRRGWAPYIRGTIEGAYPREDGREYEEVLKAHSPIHNLDRLLKVPYYINQGTIDKAVVKETHADVFVPALKASGRDVTYYVSEGADHCGFSREMSGKWNAALKAELAKAAGAAEAK